MGKISIEYITNFLSNIFLKVLLPWTSHLHFSVLHIIYGHLWFDFFACVDWICCYRHQVSNEIINNCRYDFFFCLLFYSSAYYTNMPTQIYFWPILFHIKFETKTLKWKCRSREEDTKCQKSVLHILSTRGDLQQIKVCYFCRGRCEWKWKCPGKCIVTH